MLLLNATIRTERGKKTKKLREKGILPGVLYGPKISSNVSVSLKYDDFEKIYKESGGSSLISLDIDKKESIVLIRDVVVHPITQKFIHADFYQVPMEEKITITIPFVFEGEAPAVKDEGGVLIRNVYEIDVSALPKNLPREIKVDLYALQHLNDSIITKDLVVPEGVTIDAEDDLVIVSVSAPEEAEIVEEVEEVMPEEIKTEAEEKREEEAEKEKKEEEEAI